MDVVKCITDKVKLNMNLEGSDTILNICESFSGLDRQVMAVLHENSPTAVLPEQTASEMIKLPEHDFVHNTRTLPLDLVSCISGDCLWGN